MNNTELQQSRPKIWNVGALCRAIADALESRFNPVTVAGEVSGFSRATSGHCYFSLKDESGQIRCAMFRRAASALDFSPKDGERVEVRGRLGVYEARGDLQLIVETMSRAGKGELFEQFLKLKAKLEYEGLFNASKKRPLPSMPRCIGVVTSLGAAALHDVVSTLQRRVAHIPVLIAPAAVQGVAASLEIGTALTKLYQLTQSGRRQNANSGPVSDVPIVDVILLIRGGGSMEDLWSFNDERLARLIAQSPVPIICGIGHETDFTIADFVADVRAPTPTAAAELVSPPLESLRQALEGVENRLVSVSQRSLDTRSQRLDMCAGRLGRPSSRLATQVQFLASLAHSLRSAAHLFFSLEEQKLRQAQASLPKQTRQCIKTQRDRVGHVADRLSLLDPTLVLHRGYAWVSTGGDRGVVVAKAADLAIGQPLRIHLSDGQVGAVVSQTQ
jgi:exodeoxyribonuclease VII large subunit